MASWWHSSNPFPQSHTSCGMFCWGPFHSGSGGSDSKPRLLFQSWCKFQPLRSDIKSIMMPYVIIWCMSAFAPAVEWNYGQARLTWLWCNGPWRWWHFIGSIRHQCQWLRHLIGHNVALTSVTWRWWQLWRWLLWRLLWRIWWWLAWHIWHSIIICHHSS